MIREATFGDRPAIREMRRRVWHATYEDTWPHEVIDDLFDGNLELTADHPQEWSPPYVSLVAHVAGEIVGSAGSGVLPAHHGTGVAQQLWASTVQALRTRGAPACRSGS